jgi:hypothetical protein
MRHEARSKYDSARTQLYPAIFDAVFNAALLDDKHFVVVQVVVQGRSAAGRNLDQAEGKGTAGVCGRKFEVYLIPEGMHNGPSVFRNDDGFISRGLFHTLSKVSAGRCASSG